MSGLCSKHWNFTDPDCDLCHMRVEDIFPDWEEKKKEAEESGTHKCSCCGFVYYRTVHSCPKCGKVRVSAL